MLSLALLTATHAARLPIYSACRPHSLGDLRVLQHFAIDFVSRRGAFWVAGRRKGGGAFKSERIMKNIQAGEGAGREHLARQCCQGVKSPFTVSRQTGGIIYLGKLSEHYKPTVTCGSYAGSFEKKGGWTA